MVEELIESGEFVYRLRCTCGRTGEVRTARVLAAADLAGHIQTLPRVPVDRQCRHPGRHRRRPWEPCGLCTGQGVLFELETSS